MQFYPRDWLAHPGLRMCSLAARGLWAFLVEKGLCTAAQREDYLDRGYNDVLAQVEGKAATIYTEGHG